jgi:Peptidase family M48
LNVLANVAPDCRHLVASGIVGAFKGIWRDSWGPRLEYILYNAVSALLDCRNATLLGVNRLLTDPAFRAKVIRQIKDPFIRAFWAEEYEGYDERFEPGSIVPALLLFGLLSGVVTFWFSPVAHWWSRRYEYQADAFAAEAMNEPGSLIGALRKLNEKNLSNLTPHPLYSGFYYSHPTLLEREQALAGGLRVES